MNENAEKVEKHVDTCNIVLSVLRVVVTHYDRSICRSNIVISVLQVLHEECRSPGRVELCNALLYYGNNASNGRYIMRLLIRLKRYIF